MPVISALGSLRQGYCEFELKLGNITRTHLKKKKGGGRGGGTNSL
jgi:hypothetical protein